MFTVGVKQQHSNIAYVKSLGLGWGGAILYNHQHAELRVLNIFVPHSSYRVNMALLITVKTFLM